MDYFELFSLEKSFRLNLAELEAKYLETSKNSHPDFNTSSPFDLEMLKNSALVNLAYNTLKHPFLRAEYLLLLEGGKTSEQNRIVPPEILDEVMEIRFDLESQQNNHFIPPNLKNNLTSRLIYFEDRLLILFEQLKCSIQVDRENLLNEIRLCLNSSKYFQNILAEIDN